MAAGDLFPTELINTTDLVIERPNFSDDYGDETGAPTVLGSALSAIAIPARDFTRDESEESTELVAKIIMSPTVIPAGVQERDVARWTDFYGTHEGEIRKIEPFSGVAGLECVQLRVGRRGV